MSQIESVNEEGWCQEMIKTVEKAELLMVIEYLSLIEIFKNLKENPLEWELEFMPERDPQLEVRQAVECLDPSKVERFYPHVARVLWLKPELLDCRMFTEYVKYILKQMTLEELKERRVKLARHMDGLDASVRIVYRSLGEPLGLPEITVPEPTIADLIPTQLAQKHY